MMSPSRVSQLPFVLLIVNKLFLVQVSRWRDVEQRQTDRALIVPGHGIIPFENYTTVCDFTIIAQSSNGNPRKMSRFCGLQFSLLEAGVCPSLANFKGNGLLKMQQNKMDVFLYCPEGVNYICPSYLTVAAQISCQACLAKRNADVKLTVFWTYRPTFRAPFT